MITLAEILIWLTLTAIFYALGTPIRKRRQKQTTPDPTPPTERN